MSTAVDHKYISFAAICAAIVIFAVATYAKPIDAQATAQTIYGCKVLSTSLLRIVSAPNSCIPVLESPLQWRTGPIDGTEFAFICPQCDLRDMGAQLRGANLSMAYLKNADMRGLDLTGTSFRGANLSATPWEGANLTSADFTNATLVSAEGLSSTTHTSIIWDNTICPDGTNSDSHGDSCEGHF